MLKSKHLLYLLCYAFFFLTKLDISTGLIKVCNFCTVKKVWVGFAKKKVGRVLISMLLLSLLFHAISVGAKKGIMDG